MTTELETESLELTEREMAIARGEDPDAIVANPPAETPGEAPANDEPSAVSDEVESSEQAGDPEAVQDADANRGDGGGKEAAWITENVRALAASYQLSDEELSQFNSPEEFSRATALFDKRLLAAGQGKGDTLSPVAGSPAGAPPAGAAAPDKPESSAADEDDLDLKKFEDQGYGPDVLALVKAVRTQREEIARVRKQHEEFRREAVERVRQERLSAFHSAVDGCLDETLFGRTVRRGQRVAISQEEDGNRRQVWDAARTMERILVESGQPVPPEAILVQRAAQVVLGDKMREAEQKKRQAALVAQSKRRRPAAAASMKPAPVQDAKKEEEDVVNNPKLVAAWKKLQEENGSEA